MKVAALDMDGTVYVNEDITEATQKAIAEWRAAGVHNLARGRVVQASVFSDGQAVEVGAFQNGRTLTVAEDADDSPAEFQHLNPGKLPEFIHDDTAGSLLLHAELRMLVKVLVQGFLPLRGMCCSV